MSETTVQLDPRPPFGRSKLSTTVVPTAAAGPVESLGGGFAVTGALALVDELGWEVEAQPIAVQAVNPSSMPRQRCDRRRFSKLRAPRLIESGECSMGVRLRWLKLNACACFAQVHFSTGAIWPRAPGALQESFRLRDACPNTAAVQYR